VYKVSWANWILPEIIRNYALIARPLSDLLKEGMSFASGSEQEIALNELKLQLTRAPVLSIFNVEAETEVHTDASVYEFGAIFLQKDSEGQLHPIYFMNY
jgi:hypothetical protein